MTSRKLRKSPMTGFGQYPDSVFKEQVSNCRVRCERNVILTLRFCRERMSFTPRWLNRRGSPGSWTCPTEAWSTSLTGSGPSWSWTRRRPRLPGSAVWTTTRRTGGTWWTWPSWYWPATRYPPSQIRSDKIGLRWFQLKLPLFQDFKPRVSADIRPAWQPAGVPTRHIGGAHQTDKTQPGPQQIDSNA